VNSTFATLTNVAITESLSATFPAPSTYSVISAPMVTNAGTSLTINPLFDGNLQSSITTATTSQMSSARVDTIVFTVNVKPNGMFGPFNNSVFGVVMNGTNTVTEFSENGLDPDP